MNIDIYKEAWKEQIVSDRPATSVIRDAEQISNKSKTTLLLGIASIIGTGVFLSIVLNLVHIESITTKIGIAIIALSCTLGLLYLLKVISFWLPKLNVCISTKDYCKQAIKVEKMQSTYQSNVVSIYLILLFIGTGLTIFEYTQLIGTWYSLFIYSLLILWFELVLP